MVIQDCKQAEDKKNWDTNTLLCYLKYVARALTMNTQRASLN